MILPLLLLSGCALICVPIGDWPTVVEGIAGFCKAEKIPFSCDLIMQKAMR